METRRKTPIQPISARLGTNFANIMAVTVPDGPQKLATYAYSVAGISIKTKGVFANRLRLAWTASAGRKPVFGRIGLNANNKIMRLHMQASILRYTSGLAEFVCKLAFSSFHLASITIYSYLFAAIYWLADCFARNRNSLALTATSANKRLASLAIGSLRCTRNRLILLAIKYSNHADRAISTNLDMVQIWKTS
jgi:hypothetical protein